MNIFVGNLSFAATEEDIKNIFEGFGKVISAAIVKDKKGVKSRGFGFVDMPDEQKAQAAIAALSGKEFMGRLLDISPSRPKTEEERQADIQKKMQHKLMFKAQQPVVQEAVSRDARFNPFFRKKGGYKGGRRSRSFLMRRSAAGITELLPDRRKVFDNPMRWKKETKQSQSWQKPEAKANPWRKSREEAKPWKKAKPGVKPRHKPV